MNDLKGLQFAWWAAYRLGADIETRVELRFQILMLSTDFTAKEQPE